MLTKSEDSPEIINDCFLALAVRAQSGFCWLMFAAIETEEDSRQPFTIITFIIVFLW